MLKFDVVDSKKIRVIIDTDTACEADDPFAVAYALMSPKLLVKAIVAEHFARPGSMAESYEAALRVTRAMESPVPVFRGEEGPGCCGTVSEGVREIIRNSSRRMTKAEIMAQCPDVSERTVQRALTSLMESGEIIKIGGGRYTSYIWNRGE